MIHWHELWPFLTLGLLGSWHCPAMCGGFALAATGRARSRTALLRGLSYTVGKAFTYALLALLVSQGGAFLGEELGGLPAGRVLQEGLRWVAGALLILLGCSLLGWGPTGLASGRLSGRLPGRFPGRFPGRLLAPWRAVHAGVRALSGKTGAFCLGALNGFLPCGLSWAAVLLASQASPPTATLGAFAFGMATAPVLLAVGLLPAVVRFERLRGLRWVQAAALILFGAWTCLGSHLALDSEALPACCASEASAGGALSR